MGCWRLGPLKLVLSSLAPVAYNKDSAHFGLTNVGLKHLIDLGRNSDEFLSSLTISINSNFVWGAIPHLLPKTFIAQIFKAGLEHCGPFPNTLIDGYGKYGLIQDALHLFDEMPHKDHVLWAFVNRVDCFGRRTWVGFVWRRLHMPPPKIFFFDASRFGPIQSNSVWNWTRYGPKYLLKKMLIPNLSFI